MDFVERNPSLEVGEQFELQVVADFADESDVLLPGDYLSWSSDDESVAVVNEELAIAISNGTTIFTAERDGFTAVTASRVGDASTPETEAELNTAIAEFYGLDVYPDAVTLTRGIERSILVRAEGIADSPDLTSNSTGTRYFVDNPAVISVDENGLITTLAEGEASVTVINGSAESVIPVNVETPNLGATILDEAGGIVQNSDGYQVMIPEDALTEDVEIDITTLNKATLTTPLPEQFEVYDAFNLDFGEKNLAIPAQLAIPAPEGLAPGTEVFFLKDGELPDETGTWNPIWFVQDSGIVGDDGMVRTSSPPWPAVTEGDDYVIAVPKFSYKIGQAFGSLNSLTGVTDAGGSAALSQGVAILGSFNFASVITVPFFYTETVTSLDIITVPRIGTLPFTTTAGVEINPRGIPTATANIEFPDYGDLENDPFVPPILEEARFDFNEIDNVNEPIVYLTGSNFLRDSSWFSTFSSLFSEEETIIGGNSFNDLIATFYYGQQSEEGGIGSYEGEIIPSLSRDLGNNRYEVAVKVPQTVVLGESTIELTRKQTELITVIPPNLENVEYSSDVDLVIEPENVELTLAVQTFKDRVLVFNALSPGRAISEEETTIKDIFDIGLTSRDLLLADIPVGTGGDFDNSPRDLVATNDATRAYVSLGNSKK